jgi:hypothetical protein
MSDLQLIEAVKAGNSATIQALTESGIDVNQQDEQGWTPLSWAAGKGDVKTVTLLLEKGADVFKVGRDQRTPRKIALAAGHADAVKLLKQAEETAGGETTAQPERKYTKAYHLKDMRQFSDWKENNGVSLSDDDIVFLHQDFTVTQSMWHNEDVVFDQVTREWTEFCTNVLNFRVPDDLDLIVPAQASTNATS